MSKKQFVRINDSRIVALASIGTIYTYNTSTNTKYLTKKDRELLSTPYVIFIDGIEIYRTSDSDLMGKVFDAMIDKITYGISLGEPVIDLRPVLRLDGEFHTKVLSEGIEHPISAEEVSAAVEKMKEDSLYF